MNWKGEGRKMCWWNLRQYTRDVYNAAHACCLSKYGCNIPVVHMCIRLRAERILEDFIRKH